MKAKIIFTATLEIPGPECYPVLEVEEGCPFEAAALAYEIKERTAEELLELCENFKVLKAKLI